jgi:hypothetical protein
VLLASVTTVVSVVSAGIALIALSVSGLTLFLQRPRPRMEAVTVANMPYGELAVAVRNSGTSTAKRPWFTVAVDDSDYVNASPGAGFLGVGEGRYVVTNGQYPDDADSLRGVVGCRDHRTNKLIAWSLDGRSPQEVPSQAHL